MERIQQQKTPNPFYIRWRSWYIAVWSFPPCFLPVVYKGSESATTGGGWLFRHTSGCSQGCSERSPVELCVCAFFTLNYSFHIHTYRHPAHPLSVLVIRPIEILVLVCVSNRYFYPSTSSTTTISNSKAATRNGHARQKLLK